MCKKYSVGDIDNSLANTRDYDGKGDTPDIAVSGAKFHGHISM
jgi:hypothetical protein